ncbi:hypothetical protein GY45DRAFT_1374344 [Cubamyces sp. BRFM 1775]|nr:hypothetical protein GY45DRAFT_1374344 [Cubamyces sp. BRFM 1775]
MQLTNEINEAVAAGKSNEEFLAILHRVRDEVTYTYAFSQTEAYRQLSHAVGTSTAAPSRFEDSAIKAAYNAISEKRYTQARDDDIRTTEALWWNTEPVSQDGERVTIEFRDVTYSHKEWKVDEVWPPEAVEGSTVEVFERVAQRFRVQANKKHRHPYLPSFHFDAILKSGERVPFSTLADRLVSDVVNDLALEHIVPYVRNDEKNHSVHERSPARYFELWQRTLPDWFVTPDHWIEPIPPPGYVEQPSSPPAPKEQYYKKVPTLCFPGNGRNIVPSATKPDIIVRAIFVPVQDYSPTWTTFVALQREDDLVPYDDQLVPEEITLDAARALLGRVVQSSVEARMDRSEAKRRKINKFAAQTLGYAWGLETEGEGDARRPVWLHCLQYAGRGSDPYVLDLTGQHRKYGDGYSRVLPRTISCQWVGAAVLPADAKVLKAKRAASEVQEGASKQPSAPQSTKATAEGGTMDYDKWYERTAKWIRALNRKKTAPVVEVGPDGFFVGGDLGTSKGETDEFEAEVTGAKPGVWLMSLEPAGPQDRTEDEMDQDAKVIRFVWTSDGSVNYDALPRRNRVRAPEADPEAEWEVVGSFSVDSGMVCLFSKHALDAILASGTDREAMLEAFIDDDEGDKVFVPSGIVVSGNDGSYEIQGRRDAEGRIVELKVRL